jgi:hypothetical protein
MMPIVVESQWGSNSEFVAIDASLAAKLPDTVGILNPLRPLVSLTVIQTLDRLTQNVDSCRSWGGLGGFLLPFNMPNTCWEWRWLLATASKEKAEVVIDYCTEDFSIILIQQEAQLQVVMDLFGKQTII